MAIPRPALLVLLLVSSSLAGPLSSNEIAKPRENDNNYRLPGEVIPIKYTIALTPHFETTTFTGSISIEIEVVQATKKITLHEKDLTIEEANVEVLDSTNKKVEVESAGPLNPADDYEFYIINLKTELEKGKKYTIKISTFTGVLNENRKGFYIARYNESNSVREFATTQFEPTSARLAFPCFDEPALKAVFKIYLVRPSDKYISVSNMPLVKTRQLRTTKAIEDEFEETPKMSTYLVAFIVSEMKLVKQIINKKTYGILARPNAIEDKQHEYAIKTGSAVIEEIEKFVGVDYSLLKMDQAAIPDNYFPASAMENWGLVTYKDWLLLYSDKTTTSSVHQSIATLIAHEFGHQWFGNLVTPTWWEYIWLNEGFATYFEYYAASQVEPKWHIMEQFILKNTHAAFEPDSLETTRAMNHPVGSPSEIMASFDKIAYEKSACVIRMMEAFLTTDIFKKGLKNYLTRVGINAAVATPDDLYLSLQQAVDDDKDFSLPEGLTVSTIMKTWDSQKGYPVVYVTKDYISEEPTVYINQSRFFLKNPSADDSLWTIPLNFAKEGEPQFEVTTADEWLTKDKKTITIKGLAKEKWLIVNKQLTGYYRVNYDLINWSLLTAALINNHALINNQNRAQLIDDSFNLARSGRLSYNIPFDLSLYLKKEEEYVPFQSFFTTATFLDNMISGTGAYTLFQKYMLHILEDIYVHLGFDEGDDEHLDKLNRVNVVNWLCKMGHTQCRLTSLEQIRAWKKDEEEGKKEVFAVTLNLQAPIFCGAMRAANQDDWDFLFKKYVKTTEDNALSSRIFSALGCSEDDEILKSFLKMATDDDSKIKSGDDVFASVYKSGPIGLRVAFEYVLTEFTTLHNKLGAKLGSVLSGIGAKLTTEEQLAELQKLAEEHSEQNLFEKAIANAKENVEWNENHLPEINNWLTVTYTGASMPHAYCSIFLITITYLFSQVVRKTNYS